MQLRFMGQAYTNNSTEVATVASEQIATFKGQKYRVRIPQKTVHSQQPQLRKYRGVTYAV